MCLRWFLYILYSLFSILRGRQVVVLSETYKAFTDTSYTTSYTTSYIISSLDLHQ